MSSTTIIERIVLHIAHDRGSSATTVRGALRYIRGAITAQDIRHARRQLGILPNPAAIEARQRTHADRVAAARTPEGRQAAKDAAHPRSLAAVRGALTRAVGEKWLADNPEAVAAGLRRRHCTIYALQLRLRRAEIWAKGGYHSTLQREIQGAFVGCQFAAPTPGNACALPLTGKLSRLPGHSQRERRDLSPRAGVSWMVRPAIAGRVVVKCDQDYEVRFADSGHICLCPNKFRSRDLEVTHAEHTLAVPSYGLLVGATRYAGDHTGTDRLAYRVGLRNGVLVAPDGWAWCRDNEGLHLRSADGAADYHPDAEEVLNEDVDAMVRTASEALAIRRRQEQERASELRDLEGVYVCWTDARRSGHCAAGTRAWASSHGVDVARHHPAASLYRRYGEDDRVRRACMHALRRHQTEMERGYALLADHQAPVA